jgi:hypothetical protein
MFEDAKMVGRSKSKMDRQYNGQRKKDKNDLQNIRQKIKDRATRTPLKTGVDLGYSGRVSSSCSTCCTCRVTVVTNPVINHERNLFSHICILVFVVLYLFFISQIEMFILMLCNVFNNAFYMLIIPWVIDIGFT